MNRTLMAIGAHADDNEINVGGTLLKYHDLGYDVVYGQATNNMSGHWKRKQAGGTIETRRPPWSEIMPQRKLEAAEAADKLFDAEPIHLNHPQRHYVSENGASIELRYGAKAPACVEPNTPTILTAHENESAVRRIADLILEHEPEAVLTHGPMMVDMEHVGTCLLVTKGFRLAMERGHQGMLLHWPDLQPSMFGATTTRWETFVDITGYWERKMRSIEIHSCQIPDAAILDLHEFGPECGCERAETLFIAELGAPSEPHAPFTSEIINHQRP